MFRHLLHLYHLSSALPRHCFQPISPVCVRMGIGHAFGGIQTTGHRLVVRAVRHYLCELRFVITLYCGIDSNKNSASALREVPGESSNMSASLTVDSQQSVVLKTKLEEYEQVICQQQELLLQVTWPLSFSLLYCWTRFTSFGVLNTRQFWWELWSHYTAQYSLSLIQPPCATWFCASSTWSSECCMNLQAWVYEFDIALVEQRGDTVSAC